MTEEHILETLETGRRRPPRFTAPRIEMRHGAGGKATHELIEGMVLPILNNPTLELLSDAALVPLGASTLAMTTDSFVVRPLTFPGGSIGRLAVNGTVNDLAVSGATPIALSAALIIEEGVDATILQHELEAMAEAAERAEVAVVTGDTKVVERGKAYGLYIVTTGLGVVDPAVALSSRSVRPGDRIICSGTIGDHGIAILIARGDLDLEAEVFSDTRPLTNIVLALKAAAGPGLRFMRDPTRGGVGTILNELAHNSGFGVIIREEALPMKELVIGASEILGIDPLYLPSEGKLLTVVAPEVADSALDAIRSVAGGEDAAIIGEISEQPERMVLMHTKSGGTRTIDMLTGDPLPAIF